MNPDSELFKKLVKDAGIQLVHWDDSPRLYIENMTYDGNLAKFAELIVKECAQVAFEGDLKRAIGQWGSHSDILKHFEVEHDVVKTFRS
jgi:hypothetical protein